MKKNNHYKRYLIILAIVIFIIACLIAVNSYYVAMYPGESNSNIFSMICSWLGIISSIILSVIALRVNAKYREADEVYTNQQYNFEIFKLITNQRMEYVVSIKSKLIEFISEFNYYKQILIVNEQNELYHPNYQQIRTVELNGKWNLFNSNIRIESQIIYKLLSNDIATSKSASIVCESIKKYVAQMPSNKSLPNNPGQLMVSELLKLQGPYSNMCNNIYDYIEEIDKDIAYSITDKAKDIDYIKGHYLLEKETNNGQVGNEE